MAADLPDRVDQQVAHLLRDLLQLVLGEGVQVLRAVDPVEQFRHEERVAMKSVICRSSSAPAGAARSSAARALLMRFGRHGPGPVEPVAAHVGHLAVTLIAPLRLAEREVRAGHVEDVVDDLEQNPEL